METDAQTDAALVANKIASAAMAISIAALLIGYLQLLLGNLVSGNALWKTDRAAIGVSAAHRSWRPGLRKVKVLYPQIDFRIESILEASRKSKEDSIETSFLTTYLSECERNYFWYRVRGGYRIARHQIK